MVTILNYIENNKQRFLDELFELLRIPSISALPEHAPDMVRAAEKWVEILQKAGVDKAEVCPTDGPPIVYAEKIIDTSKPTVLVYGHYDVMPVDPVNLWNTEPFEPVVKDGRIWGRGANDDKGQSFMHAKAFEYMVENGILPCNVKFMFEGEEECGSGNMLKWCAANKERLTADVILVSDTSMFGQQDPSITTGLRGLSYVMVEVTGPSMDLHSGLFGGAVANPANVLCNMIASLHDEKGRITVKGFYDDVEEVSAADRAALAKAPYDEENYKKAINVDALAGEEGYSTQERTGIRPALDVNGIWSGFTGEGSKTIIPSKAFAKISMRLVPNQDYKKIGQLFEEHFKSIAPPTVKVKATFHHGGPAYVSPTDSKGYRAAYAAYTEAFGKEPVPFRSGGSIPIIAAFEQHLGIKSILMGFGLDSDAIHSPNENYYLFNFYKGIETITYFYKYFNE
ncbi:MAG: dipeptidase [Bacteroidales bacterium]|nr:dipeptidase [Bacteroidales bacterium]